MSLDRRVRIVWMSAPSIAGISLAMLKFIIPGLHSLIFFQYLGLMLNVAATVSSVVVLRCFWIYKREPFFLFFLSISVVWLLLLLFGILIILVMVFGL